MRALLLAILPPRQLALVVAAGAAAAALLLWRLGVLTRHEREAADPFPEEYHALVAEHAPELIGRLRAIERELRLLELHELRRTRVVSR